MTNEELNAIRTVFHEETNAIRLAFREEINAAVYASETRLIAYMDERFGKVEVRLGQVEVRLGQVEVRLGQVEVRLDRLEDRVGKLEIGMQKIRAELSETIEVLNQATHVIHDIERSQTSLEERVEDNTLTIKRDVQRLIALLHNFAKEFAELNGAVNERLNEHERLSLDKAHLRPNSAA